MIDLVYRFLQDNVFTKEYVHRIKFRMSVMYPNSRKRIDKETKDIILRRCILSIIIVAIQLAFDVSLYWVILTVFAVIIVNGVAEASTNARLRLKMLKQFEGFINEIIFRYRYSGILEESLSDAIMEADYEIGLHGNFIYELITKEDYEDTLEFYKAVCPNNYFLLFYSICYLAKRNGDKLINGKSLFVNNLNCLLSDINFEINRQERINYLFSGLFMVTIMPLFAMKPIELWSSANIPELKDYFISVEGMMITVLLALFSMMVLALINRMKYPPEVRTGKNRLAVKAASFKTIRNIQERRINRNYSRYSAAGSRLRQVCSPYNIREFEILKVIYGFAGAIVVFVLMKSIGIGIFVSILSALVGGAVAACVPAISVMISHISLKENIMNEIARFQVAILMCMYQDSADASYILHHLELVAVYFKGSIAMTIDRYGGSGIDSLERLKEEEGNRQFIRIIDGLIACDTVSVPEAFEYVEKDREFDLKKREAAQEKQLGNKAALCRFIAFIPLAVTICFKLIMPFVMEGINRIQSYSDGFTGI